MIQVHMLVCENSWIIEMHGATIKVIAFEFTKEQATTKACVLAARSSIVSLFSNRYKGDNRFVCITLL
jgi:hypothetical protein